jgi:hypothetical protein
MMLTVVTLRQYGTCKLCYRSKRSEVAFYFVILSNTRNLARLPCCSQ